jgi:hypothetical protein
MTKNRFLTKLKLLRNLEEQAHALRDELYSVVTRDGMSAGAALVIDSVRNGLTEPEQAMETEEIVRSLYDLEEGGKEDVPVIDVDKCGYVTLSQKVDGGSLIAGICSPDTDGTMQACVMYRTDEDNEFDLAMAEVKRGELAVADGKTEGNKDIDLYVWSDPTTEEYQDKFTIGYDALQ